MKIGNIELEGTPLFLAPMEDVTYKSFRWMCKKFGAEVMYTEFVSSEALVRDIKRSIEKMVLFDFDRPVAIQIYGHNIDSMVRAAQVAEEADPDFIDINFGCPMKKIVRHGAGAALLKDLPKMQQMASEIVKAVKLPVTAKTRLGWTENNKPIMEVAERLQDAGIQALAIHGRTREQLYTGKADWSMISEVKSNAKIKIPIIGNGDINTSNGLAGNNPSNAFVVNYDGSATLSGELTINSDARLKSNIISLGSTLAKLMQIDGKSYTMKSNERESKIGLLAQDVAKVLPELVKKSDDSDGTLSVNYQGLIPVLINAIKEQQKEIKAIRNRINGKG